MSESAALNSTKESYESPVTPESWGKFGMWIFLAGDAMSFGILLVGYGVLRAASTNWPIPNDILGIGLTAFMTFLLIVSSLTMVKGLSAVKKGDIAGLKKYLGFTILGGVIFLSLQAYEWNHLIHEGLGFSENPWGSSLFGSTFYSITGFHGMHVTGGVIYLSIVLINAQMGKFSSENYNLVELVGLYWHFVDLVWILVFTLVYLI